ncbi:hypothetical protein HAX54_040602, partial [Datura stramonium]|nr:hypothetical protein [Datura stramonium]
MVEVPSEEIEPLDSRSQLRKQNGAHVLGLRYAGPNLFNADVVQFPASELALLRHICTRYACRRSQSAASCASIDA